LYTLEDEEKRVRLRSKRPELASGSGGDDHVDDDDTESEVPDELEGEIREFMAQEIWVLFGHTVLFV
jgi:hypothetical protein